MNLAWNVLLLSCLVLHAPGSACASVPYASASSSSCLHDGGNDSPTSFLQINQLLEVQKTAEKVEAHAQKGSHIVERRSLGQKILENQRGLYDEVERYAQRYHNQMSQAALIYYAHVSKTAGTLLCNLGAANGCRVENGKSPANNCHAPYDSYDWSALGLIEGYRNDTCAGLAADYAARNLTLEGNENYLIADGLCPQFWNVIAMREPVTRLVSHLAMLSEWYEKNQNQKYSWAIRPSSPEVLFRSAPQLANNYFIRSLLGKDVFMLPFGAINEAHLQQAKQVLEGFDVLLVADEGDSAVLENDVQTTLGWEVDHTELGIAQEGGYRRGTTEQYNSTLPWNRADWESLDLANALDAELWQHAKNLAALDTQVFQHHAFWKISATMPRTPCGYISK